MRLALHSWGDGPRTALLVHGFSDDARTWWRLGPALADLGCTVLAPDLRGHGDSPRGSSYRLQDFADDLVDTLPSGADLALGHSLGALALGLAAPRLRARRTVFVDPAWLRTGVADVVLGPLATSVQDLPAASSSWSPEDLDVELASNARVDPDVGTALAQALREGPFPAPPAPEEGSLVLVPELEPLLHPDTHALLEASGYTVVTQPGVRHVVHRDDPAGFLAVLRDQLVADELVA